MFTGGAYNVTTSSSPNPITCGYIIPFRGKSCPNKIDTSIRQLKKATRMNRKQPVNYELQIITNRLTLIKKLCGDN